MTKPLLAAQARVRSRRVLPSKQKPMASEERAPSVPPVPVAAPAPAEPASELDPRSPEYAYELYQRSISGYALLTAAEEVELAKRVQKGDKAARERMIRSNLRLVVKIALDYKNYGLPLLDLINEGNIGLVKAVDRFDPSFGAKLSTYAAFWIKQGIRRALSNQAKTIRLPTGVVQRNLLIKNASAQFESEHHRLPSDIELADILGIPEKELVKWRVRGTARTSSIDAPVADESDARTFAEILPDERAFSSSHALETSNRSETLQRLLGKLEPRERAILSERFGLDGRPERTLEEVGAEMGVTRERIRQIQEVALRKLRRGLEALDAPARRELANVAAAFLNGN